MISITYKIDKLILKIDKHDNNKKSHFAKGWKKCHLLNQSLKKGHLLQIL